MLAVKMTIDACSYNSFKALHLFLIEEVILKRIQILKCNTYLAQILTASSFSRSFTKS